MESYRHFEYCPRCAAPRGTPAPVIPFRCAVCGFTFFFNPAVAAAALAVRADGRALFIRRARDPAKGKLAMPGGFIDIGETAEQAVRRELLEEVNLEVGPLELLTTHPNLYHYQEVTYPVLDLVFLTQAKSSSEVKALEDVTSFAWEDPLAVPLEELAFPSLVEALRVYRSRFSTGQP